ncbi:hypothetical protein S40285_08135 [Stachybotrys chlorohalonatus IBT 40285]|uniref:FAD/NAD(P)-binding domain-containing protein n=1 Tax=Stachybotrys chlorohalonatus (strain IBT 40285) TaxID=1283841 RepID=A0A084QQ38_STAC4|nr:hypothetical protein S40285_08135 [Stachybotrys chlorohalonata IBT 40285]
MTKLYDVLIIGGGPAGLSIASALARQVYSALVIDSGVYRNARAAHMHNVPGFDHVPPAEYRAKVRADLLARYDTVEFQTATVKTVRKLDAGGFEAVDDRGVVYRGKKLGLGTGVRDMLEKEAEGYEECWGRGIFHCMFCHGYEERGVESAGALATGFITTPEGIMHVSLMAKRLSQSLNIYTNNNPTLAAEVATRIPPDNTKLRVDDRAIAKFALVGTGPSVTITFADGSSTTEGFVASHPSVEQAAPFAAQLGLEMTPTGEIKVTPPFNETSVPGCFAAGDAASMLRSVVQGLHSGALAGVGAVTQLSIELAKTNKL